MASWMRSSSFRLLASFQARRRTRLLCWTWVQIHHTRMRLGSVTGLLRSNSLFWAQSCRRPPEAWPEAAGHGSLIAWCANWHAISWMRGNISTEGGSCRMASCIGAQAKGQVVSCVDMRINCSRSLVLDSVLVVCVAKEATSLEHDRSRDDDLVSLSSQLKDSACPLSPVWPPHQAGKVVQRRSRFACSPVGNSRLLE